MSRRIDWPGRSLAPASVRLVSDQRKLLTELAALTTIADAAQRRLDGLAHARPQ
jgi:hypothetical protein